MPLLMPEIEYDTLPGTVDKVPVQVITMVSVAGEFSVTVADALVMV